VVTSFDIDLEHVINPKQTLKYLHLEGLERVVLSRSLQMYSTDRLRRRSGQSDSQRYDMVRGGDRPGRAIRQIPTNDSFTLRLLCENAEN